MCRKMIAWWIALCLLPMLCISAPGALAADPGTDDRVAGTWAIAQVAFDYVDTGIGGIDASFSVDEEARLQEEWILRFESGGGFSSGFSFVHDQYFAGESMNLTQYGGWALDETEPTDDGAAISGHLTFFPPAEGFGYALSLSEDDTLTLTITELYFKQSETTSQGFSTKSGEVPMTYTITLVRLPQEHQAAEETRVDTGNINQLQADGLITVAVTGNAINTTNVNIKNETDAPITVAIEPGTWFQSSSRSVQSMLVTGSREIALAAGERRTVNVPTACMNIALDIPDASNSFSISYDPSSKLAKLVAYADANNCSYEVMQAAVWIVTDNATNKTLLETLVDQYGNGVIKQGHIDEARRILSLLAN